MRETAYTRRAIRDLARVPEKTCDRITAKIDQYARAPEELANNVTELAGTDGGKRLRVGGYRVLFEEDEEKVRVMRVGKRGEVYRP